MFMKAILHNKEDDLHFLLKCLVDEIDDGLLLKQDDFEEADKKLEAAREKDAEVAEQTEKELASHIKNTMGEEVADKDQESKMVEAYNKMYSAFLNYVKDRFTDKEVIERYEGIDEKTKGRIQLLQDEIDGKTPLREGARKTPLTDAQKENYRRQIEGMKQEVANAKKNIADKKKREEKALKDIRDGKDLVIDLGSGSQFKPLTIPNADVVRALSEYKKTAKLKTEAKLSSLQRLGEKDKDIRPQKATLLEGLDAIASSPTKKLRELLGDEKVKRALSSNVEIGDKGIVGAFTELRGDDKKKPKIPTIQLNAYDRVLGLIQTELKKLNKLQTKTTTKNKIQELEKKIKDLQTLYNTYRKARNDIREDKGDTSVTPMKTTKSYYSRLRKALENFKASTKTHKDNPSRLAISARRLLDAPELGNFQTVISVIGIAKGSEVRADKLQLAEKRKEKLKTQIQSLEGKGRQTSRRNKLIQELESTIRDIEELNKYKDIKEGKIRQAPEFSPPSKQGKTMSDEDFREALTARPTSTDKIKQEIEQELSLTYNQFKADGEKKKKEKLKELKVAYERNKKNVDKEELKELTKKYNENIERINLYYSDDEKDGAFSEKTYNRRKKRLEDRLADIEQSVKKQDIVDAFLRYDINKKKEIVIRDVPFDEDSPDYAQIKKDIDAIVKLLAEDVSGYGANLETVVKTAFQYQEPDLSKEGKEKRKKLREKLEGKRKSLRSKRAGKEQIKATLPANLIKQLADVEDDISDAVMAFLTNMFPDFNLSLKIPTFNVFPANVFTKKSIEERKKQVKQMQSEGASTKTKLKPLVIEKVDMAKQIEARIDISSKGGKANKTKENYAKSSLSEHFRLFPTLIDENDNQKPNSEAVKDMWSNIIEDIMSLEKAGLTKKEKEDTKKFLEEYDKNLESKFKAFKGAKMDLLKFFQAITRFAEDYEKLADEYDKVVSQMKGGGGKTGKALESELRTKFNTWLKTNEGKELPLNFMGTKIKAESLRNITPKKSVKEKTVEEVKQPKEKTPLDFFIERMSRTLEIIKEFYRRANKVDESQRPTKEEVTTLENDVMSTIEQTKSLDSPKEIFLTKDERDTIVDGLIHLKKTIGLPTQSEKNVNNLVDLEQAYQNALDRLTSIKTEEEKPPATKTEKTPPSKEQLEAWFENWLKTEIKMAGKKDLTGEKTNLQSKAKELEERLVGLLEVFFVNIKKSSIVDFKNKLKIQDYKRNPQALRRILLTKTVADADVLDNVADLENMMKQFMGLDEKLKQEMNFEKALSLLEEDAMRLDFTEIGRDETNKIEREILEEIRAEREEGQ